jgi:hypothetical protein
MTREEPGPSAERRPESGRRCRHRLRERLVLLLASRSQRGKICQFLRRKPRTTWRTLHAESARFRALIEQPRPPAFNVAGTCRSCTPTAVDCDQCDSRYNSNGVLGETATDLVADATRD